MRPSTKLAKEKRMAGSLPLLLMIGLISGIASGMFGIGGGVLIVPALVYLAKFSQHTAIGTSLAILLPPVGLGAVLEYYRHDNVDLKAAFTVAAALVIGGWLGATMAGHVSGAALKLFFGVFVLSIGVYTIVDALQSMH
jgi:uncharacterized membrane protein YfcA